MSNRRRSPIISDLFSRVSLGNPPGTPREFSEGDRLFVKGPPSGGDNFTHTRDSDGQEIIIVKGVDEGEFSINLATTRNLLVDLKSHQHEFIKNLKGETAEKFHNVVNMIQLMYNSGAFGFIYDIIADVFKDTERVTPGTIAAYFKGCLARTDFKGNPSCTAACAGGVPPEMGTDGWQFCDKVVFLYDGRGTFVTLNEPEDRSQAIVYIPNDLNFQGFGRQDLEHLRAFGVKSVKIIRYSEDGKSYQEISSDYIDLGNMPVRQEVVEEQHGRAVMAGAGLQTGKQPVAVAPTGGSNTGLFVILLILLLLLVFFIGWKIYSNRGAMSGGEGGWFGGMGGAGGSSWMGSIPGFF